MLKLQIWFQTLSCKDVVVEVGSGISGCWNLYRFEYHEYPSNSKFIKNQEN